MPCMSLPPSTAQRSQLSVEEWAQGIGLVGYDFRLGFWGDGF